MAYADQVALAQDSAFADRVRMAIVTAAIAIAGEAQGATSDARFGKRQALAYAILPFGGVNLADAFAWAVAANPAITAASTDSDIQFTVNSVWDDLAGVKGGE